MSIVILKLKWYICYKNWRFWKLVYIHYKLFKALMIIGIYICYKYLKLLWALLYIFGIIRDKHLKLLWALFWKIILEWGPFVNT